MSNDEKKQEEETPYFDITKANTKFVVVASIICVIAIILLSVLIPSNTSTLQTSETSQNTQVINSTTETTTEIQNFLAPPTTSNLSNSLPTSSLSAKTSPKLVNCWIQVDEKCSYYRNDGIMVTGWYIIDGKNYYFDEKGIMQTNTWIDDRYVGEDGYALISIVTPDGSYVGADGIRDDSTISLETSKEGLNDLKSTLQSMVNNYSGTWSIYVKDIEHNEYLTINNVQHFSASMIKLYCAATVYDLIEKGKLEETERIDSLLTQMISISDNDAFNLLVMACGDNSHVAGQEIIQEYIDENGYKDTTIKTMLVPTKYKAPSSPGRNYTTAVDSGLLLEKIYKEQVVSKESSTAFLELLLNQTHLNKIPAGLPEGTKCANKTGDTDEVQHDAAIVYSPNGTYIISVMSSNCGSAITNTTLISETVYNYFNP